MKDYPIDLIKKADFDLEIARLKSEEKLEKLIRRNKRHRTPPFFNRILDITFLKNGHYEIKGE